MARSPDSLRSGSLHQPHVLVELPQFAAEAVEDGLRRLWREDLAPYRALRREAAFVMVAHAEYPEVAKGPASLSERWIGGVLRKKIGFRGLVISDDLEMGGVLAAAGIEEAAVETIRAGADIFLVCHNEEHVWRTYQAVYREAERDRRFRKQVEEAARRIGHAKRRRRELRGMAKAPSAKAVERLRRALDEFRVEVRSTA